MIFAKKFFIFLFAVFNLVNSVKGSEVTSRVKTLLHKLNNATNEAITAKKYDPKQAGNMSARMTPMGNADVKGGPIKPRHQMIVNNAIDQDFTVKKYNSRRAGIMSARRTMVGNADVRGVPPQACNVEFREDNCGSKAQPVFYYNKRGSRCEVGFWRGCRPNPNMFQTEYECVNTCIYNARGKPGGNHVRRAGDDYGELDDNEIPPRTPDLYKLCTGDYHFEPSVGSCYRVSTHRVKWELAAAYCRVEKAHLVVIDSDAEHDVVLRLLQAQPKSKWNYYHAGFKAENPSRVFKTIFNETLDDAGYDEWSPGEPNNNENMEYCGSINRMDGKFNDIWCRFRTMYVCEKY